MNTSHRWDVSPEFWQDDKAEAIEQARQIRLTRRALREQAIYQAPGMATYSITLCLMAAAFAFVTLAFGG